MELQRRASLALDELGAAARSLRSGQAQVAHVEGVTEACHQVLGDALASVHAAVEHLRSARR
jgi:C4-type Zn-finger protein